MIDAEHRVEGLNGLQAVLALFDGYELAAAAWEPEVLASRVREYDSHWLDQLCFTGRIGWGRLTPPQSGTGRPAARSSSFMAEYAVSSPPIVKRKEAPRRCSDSATFRSVSADRDGFAREVRRTEPPSKWIRESRRGWARPNTPSACWPMMCPR